MERLEDDLRENIVQKNVSDFYIELRVNQSIEVYIVSNDVKTVSELYIKSVALEELENPSVKYTFLCEKKAQEEDYEHLFQGDKTSYGLRRSLGALLEIKEIDYKHKNVLTFFSYKGGVGRTTSLALTAAYLSRKGKKVFVIDCDFEAPGLINFFNTSQTDNCKNGLIEYLNDCQFVQDCDIEEYVYDVEKSYSGSGIINLMPAGNILNSGEDLTNYLEGLAKIDLQGQGLVKVLHTLINDINKKYNPDVVLIDSRTGFNNTFGALAQVSKNIVVLAGDDAQNQPGIDYVTKTLHKMNTGACFVLSIISTNFSKRYNNFVNQIQRLSSFDAEIFYFDRQNTLEFIGTSLEDKSDIDDFINGENGSTQYQKFFQYIYEITTDHEIVKEEVALANSIETGATIALEQSDQDLEDERVISSLAEGLDVSIQDKILNEVKGKLPNLYAENIKYSDEYINNYFYFRPCM
ncbi:tyrosine-protein kinase family protein, partial [Pseudomonas viridiflava]